jgi:hypothetical protein
MVKRFLGMGKSELFQAGGRLFGCRPRLFPPTHYTIALILTTIFLVSRQPLLISLPDLVRLLLRSPFEKWRANNPHTATRFVGSTG